MSPPSVTRFELDCPIDRLWVEAFRAERVAGELRLGFDAPGPRSTRIHVDVRLRLRGVARPLGPRVRWLMPWAIRGDLGRVASCLPLAKQVRAADLRPL